MDISNSQGKYTDDLFQLAQIGLIYLTPDFIIEKINPEAKNLLGSSINEDSSFIEVISPESVAELTQWHLKATPGMSGTSFKIQFNQGNIAWALANFTLLGDSKGEKHILCQILNVSALNNANDQVNQESHILMELINSIPDNIFVKDIESRFLLANIWVSQLMGAQNPDELIGKTDFDFFPHKLASSYRNDELEVINTGQAKLNIIEQVVSKNHIRRWYSTSKIPLKNSKGKIIGIMGIGRDITDSVKKQKALKRAKQAAEKADQLKSAFLANLSHEVRTPLNGILGFSQYLRQLIEPGTKGQTYIDYIVQNGKQLLYLISDIIDISKLDSGQLIISKKKFILNEPLRQLEQSIRDNLNAKGKSNIELRLWLPLSDDKSVVYSDEHRIKQTIYYLLANAVKFTHEGSINFGYSLVPGGIRFFVKDTGIGIAKDKQGMIFERFTQADSSVTRQYEGTGIGLSIARGLAELLGGKLNVESEIGEGSEFYFVLPLYYEYERRDNNLTTELHKSASRVIIILCAENQFEKSVFDSIKNCGTIIHLQNFTDLFAKLKRLDRPPDLIICHPDTNREVAPDLVNRINDLIPQVPILVITTNSRSLLMEECLAAGAKDFITEPINTELLAEKIRLMTR